MRALFGFILVLLIAVVVWLGVRHADGLYCRMTLNKATYEFLNHKEKSAISRATALLERRPNYQPALEALIGWLVTSRQFDKAHALAHDYTTTRSLSPLTRFHLMICAYERGDVKEGVQLCETLTSPPQQIAEIPMPLVTTYLAAARGDYETARTLLETGGSRFRDTFWYHSLLGRVCYAQGDIAQATKELELAVGSGGQNPRTRLLLALCKALGGDCPTMERYLDALAAQGHDAHAQARSEIQMWLDRSRAGGLFIAPVEQTIQRDRVFNLRLALAALEVRQNRQSEALAILAALGREFPERIGLATRRGLLYERGERPDLALGCYREEADRLFLAAYKMATLDSFWATATENAVMKKFLTTGSLVFEAATMSPTAGAAANRGWTLFAAGEFSQTFIAGSTGRYTFDLIARGDQAEGIWPIAEIHLDGKMIAEQYVNSPVWDLFEIRQPLLAGTHWIRIIYVNNTVAPSIQGDRNLHLDKLIVRPELD